MNANWPTERLRSAWRNRDLASWPRVRPIQLSKPGPILLTLLLSASGCAHDRPLPPAPVMVPIVPSGHLMEPTPAPPYLGRTNGDLELYIGDWAAALERCNSDKAAIRTETDTASRDLASEASAPARK